VDKTVNKAKIGMDENALFKYFSSGCFGLKDFFRPVEDWENIVSMSANFSGAEYTPEILKSFKNEQLHELWYVLLRHKNLIRTEKYEAWRKKKTYEYKTDPEEMIAHSMFNIKEEIKRRSQTVQRKKRRPRRMEMTTMYDVSAVGSGSEVELDAHVLPPTIEPPKGYPENMDTHHINNYYPMDVEQPAAIAFYDKNEMDKMSLREDAAMQEHYFFAKINNMWKHYKGNQSALLSPEEYQKRLEDGYYPEKVPDWFRDMFTHDDMWMYGIWAQHGVLAHKEVLSGQKERPFLSRDYANEKRPYN